MLHPELRDRDIPHRTKIRSHIMELGESHIRDLGKEMRASYDLTYYSVVISSML